MSLTNLKSLAGTKTGTVPPLLQTPVTLRLKKSKFGQSGKGKPMTTLTFEIVEPATLNHFDGVAYDLTSLEVNMFLIYLAEKSTGQIKSGLEQLIEFHEKCGLTLDVDVEKPDLGIYDNLCIRAIVKSTERKKLVNTGVDDDGKPIRESLKDEDGNDIVDGYQMAPVNPDDILGLAKV